MKREDVQGEYPGYFEFSKAMKDKKIEGANLVAGPPVAAVTDVFATPGMKAVILEFTDEQLETINEKTAYPGFCYIIPANTYPRQTKEVRSIAQPNFLGLRAAVSEESIYLLRRH